MATGQQTTKLIIQLGDGAQPQENFAFTCGANTFGVSMTNNLGEQVALDCDDPLTVPAVVTRHLESQDTSVTLAGSVTTEAFPIWRAWFDGGTVKNIKILIDEPAAQNGGHWIVPAFLGQFEMNKEGGGIVQFQATISGAGARVWTNAAA